MTQLTPGDPIFLGMTGLRLFQLRYCTIPIAHQANLLPLFSLTNVSLYMTKCQPLNPLREIPILQVWLLILPGQISPSCTSTLLPPLCSELDRGWHDPYQLTSRTEDGVEETRYFDRWLMTPASCQPRTEACNASGSTLKQAGEWERQGMFLYINEHMY